MQIPYTIFYASELAISDCSIKNNAMNVDKHSLNNYGIIMLIDISVVCQTPILANC